MERFIIKIDDNQIVDAKKPIEMQTLGGQKVSLSVAASGKVRLLSYDGKHCIYNINNNNNIFFY